MTTQANSAASNPMPAELVRRIRLVIFDVDGVLTDAGVYLGEDADGRAIELKRFDIQDGIGIKLLQAAGVVVTIVSGRVSAATSLRARELGIEACYQEPNAHKLRVVERLLEEHGVVWEEVAMIGDDIPDLAVMRRVGLKAAVGNATPPVASIADWQATRDGGRGAAREFCDAFLQALGRLDELVERYVSERSGS
jgi:3-deoxy-D-manno-octulosonate 8-phosphate phosphatase (KDO 8-P phosphatase)